MQPKIDFLITITTVQCFFYYHNCMLFLTEWPWHKSEILMNFRDWMFLPDPDSPPDAYKLLCKSKYTYIIDI